MRAMLHRSAAHLRSLDVFPVTLDDACVGLLLDIAASVALRMLQVADAVLSSEADHAAGVQAQAQAWHLMLGLSSRANCRGVPRL